MTNEFLKLRDKMQEKYGASSVMLVSDVPVRPPLPSASLALDFAMGGGLPPDRVVEVAGQEGTGKSSFGLLSMANFLDAQPDRGAVILDLEHKLTASWVEQLIGKERMERVILAWPDHVEQATDMYTQAVSTGGISFVLVDSIGGAPSQRVTEKSAEIGNIGGNALSVTRFAQLASIHSQKYACFSGETPVLTNSGVRPIRELSGEVHRVVDGCGNWVDAKFSEYGEQKLYKVTLQRNGLRRELWATAEHRWFVHSAKKPKFVNFKSSSLDWDTVDKIRGDYSSGLAQKDIANKYGLSRACICNIVNGKVWTEERRSSSLGVTKSVSEVTTSSLSPGQTLKSGYARNLVKKTFPSQFGIAHGFVFGDGTRNSKGSSVVLWGEKDSSLLPYFSASRNSPTVNGNGTEGISVWGLPGFFKDLPSPTESTSYLYGWLSGFFAADGSVSAAGQCVITQVDRNAIEHFQLICNVLGIHTYGVSKYSGWKKDPQGELRYGETYRLDIDPYSLTDEFFVISEHHSRWKKRVDEMPNRRQEDWRVVLVEETDRTEEVYCASVDSTQSFVLAGNILTGNCLTMGINQTRDDMAGYNRLVCLAGETKVLTRKGFRPIAELAGSEHEILTENSVWTTAYVGEYGQDEMWEIEIERYGVRRTIRANGPHRWPIRRHALYHHRPAEMAPNHSLSKGSCPDPDCPLRGQCHCPLYCGIKTSVPHVNSEQRGWTKGVPLQFTKGHRASMTGLGHGGSVGLGERQMVKTQDLQEGDYLTTNTPRVSFKSGELLKWAVAWGFVFGDGTRGQGYGTLLIHDSAPKDRDILPFFDSFNVSRQSDHTRVYGFPNTFKHLPDHSEPEMFLYGWLAGYFAADGEIDRDGCASLCSSSRKNLEFVEDVCAKLGIVTGNIVDQKYGAGAYNPGETYHTLTFPVGALPKEFFVLSSHKRSWKPATATKVRWRVMGVRPTGQVERIYCASVPETETFTLQDYILTGNTPGGKGWKHACVLRIQLKRGQGKIDEKVNGEVMQVGYEIVAKVVKNQLAPQGRTANYWFMAVPTEKWGFGIDRLEEIVRIGLLTSVIRQSGAYYYEDGLPDGKIKSKEALSHYVRDNPDYYSYLSKTVMDLVTKDGEMANLVAPMGEGDEDGSE